MKKVLKITLIIVGVLIVLYILVGLALNIIFNYSRTKNLTLDESTITVTDDEYIDYIEELYINADKYIGKQIVIEGTYTQAEENGTVYHFIGKEIETEEHSHNDCEETHSVEIEFLNNDNSLVVGDYIRVIGTVDVLIEDDMEYLIIRDCDIETDIPEGSRFVR